MSWPKKFLPTFWFRFINIDSLIDRDILLIRQTSDKDIFEADGKTIKLKCVCDPVKNMDDLSFYFYGHVCEGNIILDVKKEFKKFYFELWRLFQTGRKPKPDQFDQKDEKGWFYIPLHKLHRIDFPSNDDREAFSFKMSCKIIHVPTRCNFWHVQLEWRDSTDKIITRSDTEWKRPLQTSTRVMVRNAASGTLDFVPQKIPFLMYFILPFEWLQKRLT